MAEKERFITITGRPDDTFAVWFDEYDLEPLMVISKERTQAVMDALWEMGIRPKEYDGKEADTI